MKKTKKIIASLLISVTTIALFACTGKDPFSNNGLPDPDPISGKVTTSDPVADPDPEPVTVTEEVSAVLSGSAVNYKDSILFREYYPFAVSSTGLFAEFSTNNRSYGKGSICSFDPSNPKSTFETICEDNGFGDLYLINGKDLYSQRVADTADYTQTYYAVYKIDLENKKEEELCFGTILGFSPDGKYIAVCDYTYDPYAIHYYVYDTANMNEPAADYTTAENIIFLGMDNQSMFFMNAQSEFCDYYVYQIGFDNSLYCLADCNFAALGDDYTFTTYPEYFDSISISDDGISFTVDFYEGTGHFYYTSFDISVSKAQNASPSEKPLYEATMIDSTKDDDPNLSMPSSLSRFETFPGLDISRGFARTVLDYAVLDEGIFFTMADSHRNTFEDIGWREAYMFINLDYCFLPAGKNDYVILDSMYDLLGERGNLSNYEYDEVPNTLYVYAGFFYNENKELVGVYYEPIQVSGPEGPIDESGYYYVAEFADNFHYEYPDWSKDFIDDDFFIVVGMDEFKDEVYSWQDDEYRASCLRAAEYDYEGYLVFGPDDYTFEQYRSYMFHLGFDSEGKVYYIRPVIME
ncbi:MAG: hypothetical protein J5856_05650 [Lachnospiraceae bacterium]|nr:hypothetical protein [Lachnospiraceae bacterium]